MKTIAKFIKINDLKEGDRITNGEHTWLIKKSTHTPTKNRFYLNDNGGGHGCVPDRTCLFTCIPNLKVVEEEVSVFRVVYRNPGNEVGISDLFTTPEHLEKLYNPQGQASCIKFTEEKVPKSWLDIKFNSVSLETIKELRQQQNGN